MSDCSRAAFKVPAKPKPNLSELTCELREKLDAHGIPWVDKSDEECCDNIMLRVERTKVMRGDVEIASCINGWTIINGKFIGITYGCPDRVEIMCQAWFGTKEPAPRTVDEIVSWLAEYLGVD